MSPSSKEIPVTIYQVGLLIKKIAWKMGEDFDLSPSQFEFILDTSLEDGSFRLASGPKVMVRHKIIPTDGFESKIVSILSQIPQLIRSTAIQLSSDIIASDKEFKELSPEPQLDDSEFVEIETFNVVRIRHKSGFVVTKAAPAGVGTFTKLVSLAKKETKELLVALEDSDNVTN